MSLTAKGDSARSQCARDSLQPFTTPLGSLGRAETLEQSERGRETFLEAIICAGLAISGTWPMRTELGNRMVGKGTNALASSIVLVCRKRPEDAPLATRRQFVDTLKSELPNALTHLQSGHIAPVDLAQAAIGPGMAVYTRYAKVVDRFRQPGYRPGGAGSSSTRRWTKCSRRKKATSTQTRAGRWRGSSSTALRMVNTARRRRFPKPRTPRSALWRASAVLQSRGGNVRLSIPLYLRSDWDPRTAGRVSAWLTLHHLIRVHRCGRRAGRGGPRPQARQRSGNRPRTRLPPLRPSPNAPNAPAKPCGTTGWRKAGRKLHGLPLTAAANKRRFSRRTGAGEAYLCR